VAEGEKRIDLIGLATFGGGGKENDPRVIATTGGQGVALKDKYKRGRHRGRSSSEGQGNSWGAHP